MGIVTVLWEKWIEFKRDFVKITLAAMIAPLLYVVVFGRGIGELSGGQPYLNLIGGSLRGMYAGCLILLLTLPFVDGLRFNGWSFLVMFLNGAVFSAIGVVVSFYAKKHSDVPRFSNYVIMPMSFLCNTFFSTETLPGGLRQVIGFLPLSQTSIMLRQIAGGAGVSLAGIAVLSGYLGVFTLAAFRFLYKKKNL